jgi:hypothetical protein
MSKQALCMNGYAGYECDLGELMALAILFWISGLVSILLLVFGARKSKYGCVLRDQTVLFWFFLAVWQGYRGAICFFSVPKGKSPPDMIGSTVSQLLMFIPMSLVTLNLFELLFTYRNPGTNAIVFFRGLFVLFIVVFLALGIVLSLIGLDDDSSTSKSIALWCACTNLILAIFFALPARSLLEAVTYPMVQPEDVCYVNFCKVGIVIYVLLFAGRMLWTGTDYFAINKLQVKVLKWADKNGDPNSRARAFNFIYHFLFDFLTSVLAMVSVCVFKKHDIMFNENPYYTRERVD